ncbi:MAG: biopolymer transporter ExbD [Chloracidobacterium sp.]|nr:biopolymer transporter ExbD [Chloracidobacterium sp.]
MSDDKHNKKPAAPFINVTPLIDVLLVLLIIFMIISPSRARKFDARVPDRPEGEKENNLALVVTIDHGGGYALNMRPARTLDDLQSLMRRALDARPTDLRTVFLKAPRELNYGEVAKVIDVMKLAGCAPIVLQLDNL